MTSEQEKNIQFETAAGINVPWLFLIILSAIVLVPIYVGSNHDAEDYIFTIPSTVLHIRSLFDGEVALWASQYGFGIPLPFSQHLNYHPLLPLFLLDDLNLPLLIFYSVHLVICGVGFWRLIQHFQIERVTSYFCLYTFFLCATTLNLFQTDFWLNHMLAWSIAPWILLAAFRFNTAETKAEAYYLAVLIGFLTAFMTINGHVGYVILFYFPTAAILLINWRHTARHWLPILSAIGLYAVLIAPKILPMLISHGEFPDDAVRTTEGIDLSGSSGFMLMWAFFFKPLKMVPMEMLANFDFVSIIRHLYDHNVDSWVLYYGNIFSVLTLVGLAIAYCKTGQTRTLAVAFTVVAVMLFLPIEWFFQVLTANFLFRDPITMIGILLAGIAVTALMRKYPFQKVRFFFLLLLTTHAVILFVTMSPIIHQTWIRSGGEGNGEGLSRLKDVTAERGVIAELKEVLGGKDHRIFLSDRVLFDSRNYKMVTDGWVSSGPGLYGINFVNGYFKGISVDRVYPTENIMMGRIGAQDDLFSHTEALDVLAVTHALVYSVEPPVADWPLVHVFNLSGDRKLHLYQNQAPWARATLYPIDAKKVSLSKRGSCIHDRMLCLNFSPLAAIKNRTVGAETSYMTNGIDVDFDAAPEERLLVVSEYFHTGWKAYGQTADGQPDRLETFPYQDGMLGVVLPAGLSSAELRFERPVFWWSLILPYPILAASLVLLLVLRRRI